MRALVAWTAITTLMVLTGCASVKPGVREANIGAGPALPRAQQAAPLQSAWSNPVRDAACHYCLKPRTAVERAYLERWRDGLDAILGDRK